VAPSSGPRWVPTSVATADSRFIRKTSSIAPVHPAKPGPNTGMSPTTSGAWSIACR
jgi:hypothetical protein